MTTLVALAAVARLNGHGSHGTHGNPTRRTPHFDCSRPSTSPFGGPIQRTIAERISVVWGGESQTEEGGGEGVRGFRGYHGWYGRARIIRDRLSLIRDAMTMEWSS